jgi:hypothetical protein
VVHTSAPFSREEAYPISDTMSLLTFGEVRGGMLGVWEVRRFVSGVLIEEGIVWVLVEQCNGIWKKCCYEVAW